MASKIVTPRKTKKTVPNYSIFFPRPDRATPFTAFEKLSFVRPHGSRGGFSAWDPPQASKAVVKKVFTEDEDMKNADFEGVGREAWIQTAHYSIGCEIGRDAAQEWFEYLAKNWNPKICNPTLPKIVGHMLGWPTLNEQNRGAAIAFFSELEELIGAASIAAKSVAKRREGRRASK